MQRLEAKDMYKYSVTGKDGIKYYYNNSILTDNFARHNDTPVLCTKTNEIIEDFGLNPQFCKIIREEK